jgi:HTH-type transcriptional regulator/antitoxin HigA
MDIRPLHTPTDYQQALAIVSRLVDLDPEVGTPEGDKLEILATLIEAYEQEHFPFDAPDPIEAIKYCMEQQGLSQADLIPFCGTKSRVSEILNRKRALSISMIRKLHAGLGIPLSILLQETFLT